MGFLAGFPWTFTINTRTESHQGEAMCWGVVSFLNTPPNTLSCQKKTSPRICLHGSPENGRKRSRRFLLENPSIFRWSMLNLGCRSHKSTQLEFFCPPNESGLRLYLSHPAWNTIVWKGLALVSWRNTIVTLYTKLSTSSDARYFPKWKVVAQNHAIHVRIKKISSKDMVHCPVTCWEWSPTRTFRLQFTFWINKTSSNPTFPHPKKTRQNKSSHQPNRPSGLHCFGFFGGKFFGIITLMSTIRPEGTGAPVKPNGVRSLKGNLVGGFNPSEKY